MGMEQRQVQLPARSLGPAPSQEALCARPLVAYAPWLPVAPGALEPVAINDDHRDMYAVLANRVYPLFRLLHTFRAVLYFFTLNAQSFACLLSEAHMHLQKRCMLLFFLFKKTARHGAHLPNGSDAQRAAACRYAKAYRPKKQADSVQTKKTAGL